MRWRTFALGAVAGLVAGAGGSVLWASSRTTGEQSIVFPDKQFFDSVGTGKGAFDGFVTITGTITGGELAYKNNTLTLLCWKQEMRCKMASTSQIGGNQIGAIDIEDFDIVEWTPTLIALTSQGFCADTTINISRNTEEVDYVVVPTNQTNPGCKFSSSQIRKMTIGPSPYWQNYRAKEPAKK